MAARKFLTQNVLRSMIAGAALAGGALACTGTAAQAQVISFGRNTRSVGASGGVNDRDLASLIQTLRLDAQQEELIRALHEGHRAAWTEAATAHRESVRVVVEAARAAGDFASMGTKMRDAQKKWTQEGEALEQDFFNNVKSLVSEEQVAAWPRFERDRRRRTLLSTQSLLSGEGVDLIDVADSVDLAPESLDHLRPVFDLYATDVDQAITDRTRAIKAVEEAVSHAAGAEIDFEALGELQSKLHHRRLLVRDLNERYVTLFEGQLGKEEAERLRQEYRERSFPRVYRPTAADRYLDTVEGLATLSDEQTQALTGLGTDYDRQVSLINDQLAQILRAEDEERTEQRMFLGGGGGMNFGVMPDSVEFQSEDGEGGGRATVLVMRAGGDGAQGRAAQPPQRAVEAESQIFSFGVPPEDEDSPRGKLNRSKRELVSRTIESAHVLLTPEQQALAPKPDERQRLSPEERGRLRVREALEGAVIQTTGDGITITVDSTGGGK